MIWLMLLYPATMFAITMAGLYLIDRHYALIRVGKLRDIIDRPTVLGFATILATPMGERIRMGAQNPRQ